jgi:Fic family protein
LLVYLREQYHLKVREICASIRLSQAIESLFESPLITIPQMAKAHNISYPTARTDIDTLVDLNILFKSEIRKRPHVFFAPEILKCAYSDLHSD